MWYVSAVRTVVEAVSADCKQWSRVGDVLIREDATRPDVDNSQIRGDIANFRAVLCTRATETQTFCRKEVCIYAFICTETMQMTSL